MNLKSAIRPFVPPVLYEAVNRMKSRLSYSPRSSFDEAARECGVGYSNPALLSPFHDGPAHLTEMPDYLAAFLASMAYAASNKTSLRILDFGGASGYFRAYARSFYSHIATDWTIIETAAQVELNKDLDLPDVRYSTEIDSKTYDLAIFSGSLQFLPDWRVPLGRVKAHLVYIARTPLGKKDQPFVQRIIKNGAAFSYAGQVISETSLRNFLEASYTLQALWKFDAHFFELGVHSAPAMLWERN